MQERYAFWRHLATGAALFSALAGCSKGAPAPETKPSIAKANEAKPSIAEAFASAKIPRLPRSPVIPARRTNVLPVPPRVGPPDNVQLVALGKKIFFDARLSEPPGTSCSSCHDPARAFSGAHGSSLGVPQGSRAGHFARRSAPSVLYMRYVPKFHFFEDDEAPQPEPRGGYFWDGRSDSLVELVKQPLFNPEEMNAGSPELLATKITQAPYAKEFRAALASASVPASDPATITRGVGVALEAYLKSDEMTPASSKYDAYVRGQATLTEQERRGLELFKDRRHGACSGCHRLQETSTNPAESMFTDYGYDAVAWPRNRALPANHDDNSFDLGLCERKDTTVPSKDERLCSNFRTPSLRNVAVRESYGHNGVYKTLREVVSFYAYRAVAPSRIYPEGQKFDDVPAKYRENVNIYAPIYNQKEGATPPLSEDEIDAIVAFLGTLTDAPYLPKLAGNAPIAPASAPRE
ncbi:MAG: cytochrome c peroxidase [Pseudomonadota bacterium]